MDACDRALQHPNTQYPLIEAPVVTRVAHRDKGRGGSCSRGRGSTRGYEGVFCSCITEDGRRGGLSGQLPAVCLTDHNVSVKVSWLTQAQAEQQHIDMRQIEDNEMPLHTAFKFGRKKEKVKQKKEKKYNGTWVAHRQTEARKSLKVGWFGGNNIRNLHA